MLVERNHRIVYEILRKEPKNPNEIACSYLLHPCFFGLSRCHCLSFPKDNYPHFESITDHKPKLHISIGWYY